MYPLLPDWHVESNPVNECANRVAIENDMGNHLGGLPDGLILHSHIDHE